MKKSYTPLTIGVIAALSLIPAPSRAQQGSDSIQIAALTSNNLDLYFDQAELTTVESATRAPKPITQVAENISIITAQDIERWNAHSLQDVLAHVPGVLVHSMGRDVANMSSLSIQGSDYEHVQVFLDGMRWNDILSDYNQTNQIPVEIIDRVEIIKGPGSSTWGSALGGVINIITKGTGNSATPSGTVTASLGERQTEGVSAQMSGLAGPVGYFLHGGSLSSDGLRDDRWLDSDTLYAKLSTPLPGQTTLTLSMARFAPAYRSLVWLQQDYGAQWSETDRFATATLDRPLGDHFHLQFYGSLVDKSNHDYRELPLSSHTPSWDYTLDEWGRSGAVRLYGDLGRHSLSIGGDTYRNSYKEYESLWVQHWGKTVQEETWSVYANDTIHLGRATLTPGLRYDSISIADAQLCPSLGLTYRLNDTTLLRALTARGFRRPVPGLKTPDPDFFSTGNPQLESEIVKTYQVGIENTALPHLRLKTTLFRHDSADNWEVDSNTWAWVNGGNLIRNGIELEVETERWYGLTLTANHTHVRFTPDISSDDPGDTSFSNLIFDYEGPWGLNGRLSGNYTWLNGTSKTLFNGRDDTMTWDLSATKTIRYGERYRFDIFTTATNLFNGSHYDIDGHINADRWLEAGLRFHF